jgi:hypothetical protein
VREVSKAFEADLQAFNGPLDSCNLDLSAKGARDFHMEVFEMRWDDAEYPLPAEEARSRPPRDPKGDDSGMETVVVGPCRLFYERAVVRCLGQVSQKGTIPPSKALSPSLRLGATNAAMGHDDLSQGSDRFGQPGLDAAYLCPSC